MHLLKNKVNHLVINMCLHENDDNGNDNNCHQQHGIDIDVLKKCVNCTQHGKKEEHGIFCYHIKRGTEKTVQNIGLALQWHAHQLCVPK